MTASLTNVAGPSPRYRFTALVTRHYPVLLGAVALLPFLFFRHQFADMFWFGDDWDQMDQILSRGWWSWTWTVFAENFVPLFKILWSSMLVLTGGSHLGMLAALWLTHAINVVLVGRLMQREGLGWIASTFAMLAFGLSAANVETLTWSVQWCSILATTFFLCATLWYTGHDAEARAWSWSVHGVLMLWIAASALSFSRGVLTGAVFAATTLLPLAGLPWRSGQRARTAIACLLPGILVAALIYVLNSVGNHRHLGEQGGRHLAQALEFGAWNYGLSPVWWLLRLSSASVATVVALDVLKVALVAWTLWRSEGRARRLLTMFALLELCNALLLGIGRYHTGLGAAHSSRYQYNALLCTAPFLGFWLDAAISRCVSPARRLHPVVAIAMLCLVALHVAQPWRGAMRSWSAERGLYTRRLLFVDPHPPAENAIPGISFMPTARAKALIAHYHLH